METVFYILGIFIIKHLLVDIIWQPQSIAIAKKDSVSILTVHCLMHWAATAFILSIINLFWFQISPLLLVVIPLIDLASHWVIDYITTRVSKRLDITPEDKLFWNIHGIDQTSHYVMYLLISYLLV